MILPGGTPGTAFTKSATTRFNNGQINAQRLAMPHNAAAQASLRKQTSKSTPNGAPVTPAPPNANELLAPGGPMGPEQVQMPTGGPGMAPEAGQDFDPAVFQEELANTVVGTIRTQKFINSPRVKDAAASVRLKNFFNNTNPNAISDKRTLFEQVLDRIRGNG